MDVVIISKIRLRYYFYFNEVFFLQIIIVYYVFFLWLRILIIDKAFEIFDYSRIIFFIVILFNFMSFLIGIFYLTIRTELSNILFCFLI